MKNVMNEELVDKSIKKIKMYKQEEDISFENISVQLKNIDYNYKSDSTTNLDSLEKSIKSNLNTITKIHNNNVIVLEKNLITYKETKQKVERMFDNINR